MKKLSDPLILGDKTYYKYLIIWEDILGVALLRIKMKMAI